MNRRPESSYPQNLPTRYDQVARCSGSHQWLAKGSRDQTIADTLGMSVRTVETHLNHIYLELEVKRAAAVPYAFLSGADNAPQTCLRDFTGMPLRAPFYYQSENQVTVPRRDHEHSARKPSTYPFNSSPSPAAPRLEF